MSEDQDTFEQLFVDREGKRFWPFDVNVEQTLIGLALIEPLSIPIMQSEMKADDLYDEMHRLIYERILAKFDADKPVTPLTLTAALKNQFAKADFPGHAYLIGCAQAAPAYTSLDQLFKIVKDLARLVADHRARRDAGEAIIDAVEAFRSGEPLAECLEPVVAVADSENERLERQRNAIQISDAAYELMRDLNERQDHKLPAAPTGLRVLDEAVGGNFPGELVVVGGRPGMGKSIIGQMFARAAAEDGFSVDYFDLENKTGVLTARLLCDLDYDRALREGRPPIHYSRIRLNRLSADERMWLAEASLKLRDLDIEVHDREELTMENITSLARAKRARTKKPMMVVIDHMHLVEPSGRYAGRKVDEVSETTKGAKRLAKRNEASVILLAQLNRGVEGREDKRPTMADFRESGSIEQDADTMYGAHRLQYYLERNRPRSDATDEAKQKHAMQLMASTNVLDMGLLKNRNGATTDLQVFIDVASASIRDEKPMTGDGGNLTGLFA